MNDLDAFFLAVLVLPPALLAAAFLAGRPRAGSRRPRIAGVLLALGALALVFLAGETWYRFFVDTTDTFGLNKVTQRWGARHWRNNNMNSRDDLFYEGRIAPGKRRVTFIGDSFTAGHGVKKVKHRFVNRIRDRNPELEVHVLATNGLESDDVLEVLGSLPRGYEVDALLLVYNLNDISWAAPEIEALHGAVYDDLARLGFFTRQSYLLNTLFFRLTALGHPELAKHEELLLSAYEGEAWEAQTRTLAAIASRAREEGWHLMVATFPFLTELGADYRFREVHVRLAGFWQEQGVPHRDLLPLLEAHRHEELRVNPRDAHPNERAHELVSEPLEALLFETLSKTR